MLPCHTVDFVGHAVEVQGDGGLRHVGQRHFDIFELGPIKVGDLDGGIDDAGDASSQKQVSVGGNAAPAQVQRGGDLGDASQRPFRKHARSHQSSRQGVVASGGHGGASRSRFHYG